MWVGLFYMKSHLLQKTKKYLLLEHLYFNVLVDKTMRMKSKGQKCEQRRNVWYESFIYKIPLRYFCKYRFIRLFLIFRIIYIHIYIHTEYMPWSWSITLKVPNNKLKLVSWMWNTLWNMTGVVPWFALLLKSAQKYEHDVSRWFIGT